MFSFVAGLLNKPLEPPITSFIVGPLIVPLPPLYAAIALGYWLLSISSHEARRQVAPIAAVALLAGLNMRQLLETSTTAMALGVGLGICALIIGLAVVFRGYPHGYLRHFLASAALWVSLDIISPFTTPLASCMTPLSLYTFKGQPQRLELTNGTRPHVLLLWQSDCKACLPLLAELDQLAERHPKVGVVSINQGEPLLAALRALNAHTQYRPIHLALWDRHQFSSAQLEIAGLPVIVLVHPDGHIAKALGGQPSASQLDRLFYHAEHLFEGDVSAANR